MRIRFDPIADAAYVQFRRGSAARTEEVPGGFIVDYNRLGKVIGIELLAI